MNLKNVVIVLVHPDESRNIGAACRAMANNDISELRIVGNKGDYDIEHIHVLAIHAAGIFDKAVFYPSIKEATSDCVLCAGTTRRAGKKRGKLLLPEEFAQKINDINGKVAVIFGNERTGLTDEELDECNAGVTIPSSKGFGSLNLSHAVQILCYHIYREFLREQNKAVAGVTPVTLERLDSTVKTISNNLEKVGFFKMPGREDMESFWRNILSRAALTEGEAKYLEKTFDKISGLARKNSEQKK
jgi:tRNA/rRNA methyltransferase